MQIIHRRTFVFAATSLCVCSSFGARALPATLSDKALQTKLALKSASGLKDVLATASNWNQVFAAAIRNIKRTEKEADRDRARAAITDKLKEAAFEKFLKENLPSLYQLWDLFSLPDFMAPLIMFFDASEPSPIVSEYVEYTQLDDTVQNDIREAASRFLPEHWQSAVVNELKAENAALGADLNSNLP